MFNDNQEHHEFLLGTTYESGAVEWYCPTCGRRLLMKGSPSYEMVILETGDNYAIHSGGTGGFTVDSLQVNQISNEESWGKDPTLRSWADWMEQVDFDKKWNS